MYLIYNNEGSSFSSSSEHHMVATQFFLNDVKSWDRDVVCVQILKPSEAN